MRKSFVRLNFNISKKYAVLIYHPETKERNYGIVGLKNTIEILYNSSGEVSGFQIDVTGFNNKKGNVVLCIPDKKVPLGTKLL